MDAVSIHPLKAKRRQLPPFDPPIMVTFLGAAYLFLTRYSLLSFHINGDHLMKTKEHQRGCDKIIKAVVLLKRNEHIKVEDL
jgi:hypothetical protein